MVALRTPRRCKTRNRSPTIAAVRAKKNDERRISTRKRCTNYARLRRRRHRNADRLKTAASLRHTGRESCFTKVWKDGAWQTVGCRKLERRRSHLWAYVSLGGRLKTRHGAAKMNRVSLKIGRTIVCCQKQRYAKPNRRLIRIVLILQSRCGDRHYPSQIQNTVDSCKRRIPKFPTLHTASAQRRSDNISKVRRSGRSPD